MGSAGKYLQPNKNLRNSARSCPTKLKDTIVTHFVSRCAKHVLSSVFCTKTAFPKKKQVHELK